MKKNIIIVGGILLIIGLGVLSYFLFFKEEVTPKKSSLITIEEQVKNITKNEQNDLKFSNVNIKEFGATILVSGRVKNLKKESRNVKITLKMYNSDSGKTLGIIDKTIELKSSGEEEFELGIMGDYRTINQYELLSIDVK